MILLLEAPGLANPSAAKADNARRQRKAVLVAARQALQAGDKVQGIEESSRWRFSLGGADRVVKRVTRDQGKRVGTRQKGQGKGQGLSLLSLRASRFVGQVGGRSTGSRQKPAQVSTFSTGGETVPRAVGGVDEDGRCNFMGSGVPRSTSAEWVLAFASDRLGGSFGGGGGVGAALQRAAQRGL